MEGQRLIALTPLLPRQAIKARRPHVAGDDVALEPMPSFSMIRPDDAFAG